MILWINDRLTSSFRRFAPLFRGTVFGYAKQGKMSVIDRGRPSGLDVKKQNFTLFHSSLAATGLIFVLATSALATSPHPPQGTKAEIPTEILQQIDFNKAEILQVEDKIRASIEKRQYAKAANDLENARAIISKHDRLLQELETSHPANASYRLLHRLPEVEALLIQRLADIKLSGPTECFALTKSEMPEWGVLVTDAQGPLPGFPLMAKQGRQTLAEKRSQQDGYARFLLRKVNFETGPFSVNVLPNLPADLLKAAGLERGFEVSYQVSRTRCDIRLECDKIANFCTAAEEALNKRSIFCVTNENAPKLTVNVSTTEKDVSTAGKPLRNFYDIGISVQGEKILFRSNHKGEGKNALEATIKAVQETDFAELRKQLSPYCH